MNIVNLNPLNIARMKQEDKDDETTKWDSLCWSRELQGKRSPTFYKEHKSAIKSESNIYDNTYGSDLMFRAKTNTLSLGWPATHTNTYLCTNSSLLQTHRRSLTS